MGLVDDAAAALVAELVRVRAFQRERAARPPLIPYHPVLAGMLWAAAVVGIAASAVLLVWCFALVTDDLMGILAILLFPLAFAGAGAAASVTGAAVRYSRRRS